MVVEDTKASTVTDIGVEYGRGISTIVVTAGCQFKGFENEDFGGASKEFTSPSGDTIFELGDQFPDWDDKILSYECHCPG